MLAERFFCVQAVCDNHLAQRTFVNLAHAASFAASCIARDQAAGSSLTRTRNIERGAVMGEVRMNENPRSQVTARSKAIVFTGSIAWS